VRIASRGALVQQANAIESLSNVDVLCLDKTGTLTTNRIQLHAVHPIGIAELELRALLGDFAASTSAGNRTSEAIGAQCIGQPRRAIVEVPFSSARKWSALALEDSGTYVLGAPEVLAPYTPDVASFAQVVDGWTARGLRVVLFAYRPDAAPLHDSDGQPRPPENLVPLGLVALSDELRPEAHATLSGFAAAGVHLKHG
jgi:cation-transporting ATPase E